jgi:hypothetical protein
MNLLPNLEPIWNISLSECMRSQMVQFCEDFLVFIILILFQFFLANHIILKFSIEILF